MTAAQALAPWMMCQACGAWQRASEPATCSTCQWTQATSSAPSRRSADLPVLLDVELRSDRTWHVATITTDRLGAALDHAIALQHLNGEGLLELTGRRASREQRFPPMPAWERFRHYATELITREANAVISRSWAGLREPSPLRARIAIRALVLDPDIEFDVDIEESHRWLQVLPFDEAAAAAARQLRVKDVQFDLAGTSVGFGEGGDRVVVSVRTPREVMVRACEVVSDERVLLEAPVTRVVRRDALTALPPIALPANAVRGFAQAGRPHGELRLSVHGADRLFMAEIPLTDLPPFDAVGDLLLDLGSTTTKWALLVRGSSPIEQDQDTALLTQAWGIEPYRKAELMSDPEGEAWAEWVARALPALRAWVGREHRAYLRNVYLSLPSTEEFDVIALGKSLSERATAGLDPDDSPTSALGSAQQMNLIANGQVKLLPEHQLAAEHYLGVLRTLQRAASEYAARFKSSEQRRAAQAQRQAAWDEKNRKLKAYERKFFLARLFATRPDGPTGARPSVASKAANPAAWMNDLIEHPEQFDQIVLLDAGGLSLDISVIYRHRLVPALSFSDATCGGEAVSSRIGRGVTGSGGTRYKAQLGLRWDDAPDLSDPAQREYLDVTRELYEPVLKRVFQTLGESRWTGSRHCCVLLTGGGSRNPHLGQLVAELAAAASLDARVVDAPVVEELILQARAFPAPLRALDSQPVERFEITQTWSARRERHARARYDKFAVVGGMWANLGED